MKKLYSVGKPICELTDEEATSLGEELLAHPRGKISVHGQTINSSGAEIKSVDTSNEGNELIEDIPTPRLKELLGDFELNYRSHYTGENMRNPILGLTKQGIIDWCIDKGVIVDNGNDYWAVTTNWPKWHYQYKCMRVLRDRRLYASEKELLAMEPPDERLENLPEVDLDD